MLYHQYWAFFICKEHISPCSTMTRVDFIICKTLDIYLEEEEKNLYMDFLSEEGYGIDWLKYCGSNKSSKTDINSLNTQEIITKYKHIFTIISPLITTYLEIKHATRELHLFFLCIEI